MRRPYRPTRQDNNKTNKCFLCQNNNNNHLMS